MFVELKIALIAIIRAWVGNLKQRVPITSKSSKFKGETQHYVVKWLNCALKIERTLHGCGKIQCLLNLVLILLYGMDYRQIDCVTDVSRTSHKYFSCNCLPILAKHLGFVGLGLWCWNMVILELKTWFRQRVMHTTVHCRKESISLFSHSTIVGWNPVWGYSYFRFNETFMKYF